MVIGDGSDDETGAAAGGWPVGFALPPALRLSLPTGLPGGSVGVAGAESATEGDSPGEVASEDDVDIKVDFTPATAGL